jgi:hypothetical protein
MSQTRLRPRRESPPGIPRWVKVFGIAVIILLLLFGLLHLSGSHLGGHMPPVGANDPGGQTPPTEQGVQPLWP